MNDEETIAMFQGAKTALLEKGWAQGDYVNDVGNLCLLGACCVAVYGKVKSMASEDDYPTRSLGDLDATVTDMLREQLKLLEVAPHRWNDEEGRTFNEVIELLDTAVIKLKEKSA